MNKVLIILAAVLFLALGAAMLTAQEASNCAEVAKQQCVHLEGDTDAYNQCWNEAFEQCNQSRTIQ